MLIRLLEGGAGTDGGNGGGAGGIIGMLLPIALIFVFMYFFMIRPQKQQDREIQEMRDALQIGDEVTTIGGIIGKIISIKEETCLIETSGDKTKIRILKSAVKVVDVKAEDAE